MQVNISLKQVVDNSYDITIDTLPQTHFDTKVAIVTNPKVAGLHLAYLLSKISAKELYIITVPDGEEYKNQTSIDLILESLFNHRFNRKSMLIAFGGGVIGDMTGYAASIYQRGIAFVQIPTTIENELSQNNNLQNKSGGINTVNNLNFVDIKNKLLTKSNQEEYLKKLLQDNPNNPTLLFLIAAYYHRNKNYSEAEKVYKKILDLKNNHKESLYFLGSLYNKHDRFDESYELYKKLMDSGINYRHAKEYYDILAPVFEK